MAPSAAESGVRPFLFFDGECGFCDRTVRFFLVRTAPTALSFAPLQSSFAQATLAQYGVKTPDLRAAYLLRDGRLYSASSAILEALRLVPGLMRHLAVLAVIPRPIRDGVYFVIARARRQLAAPMNCRVLTPEERARFVE